MQVCFIFLILISTMHGFFSAKELESLETEKITSCRVKLSNGKYIDLTSLFDENGPLFANSGLKTFEFNPCMILRLDFLFKKN